MSFLTFPWKHGIKPDFVNEEGFEWWKDDDINRYIRSKELKNHICFLVKKNDKVERVLLNTNQQVVFATTSLEDMGAKVDMLTVAQSFGDL